MKIVEIIAQEQKLHKFQISGYLFLATKFLHLIFDISVGICFNLIRKNQALNKEINKVGCD
jgi:hypothetical protein